MKHRKLRIAWSVVWGMVAVLLIVLWVQSYWRCDNLTRIRQSSLTWCSINQGISQITHDTQPIFGTKPVNSPRWSAYSTDSYSNPHAFLGFKRVNLTSGISISVPIWSLLLLCAVGGFARFPMWANRFSLRTLLFATTLVAVALGLIVWLVS